MSKTDDYLKKIADALNNYDPRTAGALVEEIASVFSEEIPSVKKGLDRFKGRISVEGSAPSYDFAGLYCDPSLLRAVHAVLLPVPFWSRIPTAVPGG